MSSCLLISIHNSNERSLRRQSPYYNKQSCRRNSTKRQNWRRTTTRSHQTLPQTKIQQTRQCILWRNSPPRPTCQRSRSICQNKQSPRTHEPPICRTQRHQKTLLGNSLWYTKRDGRNSAPLPRARRKTKQILRLRPRETKLKTRLAQLSTHLPWRPLLSSRSRPPHRTPPPTTLPISINGMPYQRRLKIRSTTF